MLHHPPLPRILSWPPPGVPVCTYTLYTLFPMGQFRWYAKRSKPVLSLLYLRPSHDFLSPFKVIYIYKGSSKMAQWVKVIAVQTDSLSSIPSPYIKGYGKKPSPLTSTRARHTTWRFPASLPPLTKLTGPTQHSLPGALPDSTCCSLSFSQSNTNVNDVFSALCPPNLISSLWHSCYFVVCNLLLPPECSRGGILIYCAPGM